MIFFNKKPKASPFKRNNGRKKNHIIVQQILQDSDWKQWAILEFVLHFWGIKRGKSKWSQILNIQLFDTQSLPSCTYFRPGRESQSVMVQWLYWRGMSCLVLWYRHAFYFTAVALQWGEQKKRRERPDLTTLLTFLLGRRAWHLVRQVSQQGNIFSC